MKHCQYAMPECLRVAQRWEYHTLSAQRWECNTLSERHWEYDALSVCWEHDSLSGQRLEYDTFSTSWSCYYPTIMLTAAQQGATKKTTISDTDDCWLTTLVNSASTAPPIGLPPKGAEFCHTSNRLLVGRWCRGALSRPYFNSSAVGWSVGQLVSQSVSQLVGCRSVQNKSSWALGGFPPNGKSHIIIKNKCCFCCSCCSCWSCCSCCSATAEASPPPFALAPTWQGGGEYNKLGAAPPPQPPRSNGNGPRNDWKSLSGLRDVLHLHWTGECTKGCDLHLSLSFRQGDQGVL